jgi:dTDP-4-dehydrorhamnose 3,5-epimerase
MENSRIEGVEFKELRTHADDRGFFREVIRNTDTFFLNGFAQWSHSRMATNTVKAWHYHHLQTDWWYLGTGVIEVVLFDLREESPTFENKLEFKLGDPAIDPEAQAAVVRIPPGVAHGCKVVSELADLFYITSRVYDPNDEGRYPFNSTRVPHSWGNDESVLIVADNDRREFIPTAERAKL